MPFTQEHEEIRRTTRKFIETEVNPFIDEWEAKEIFPAHELFRKMGKAGLLGIHKPTAYGGMGLDYSYEIAFVEELGTCRAGGVPMAIGVQTDMATPALARYGSDALRKEFLAPSISGDFVACLGVSEVGAGSDVAGIKTSARKDGDDYVINGGKMWTTNGTQADWMCLLANTGEGQAHVNKSLICVPMKTKGVSVARKLKKIGMMSSDTAQIHLDDVRVPRRNLIGEEGMGFVYQMQQFQEERMWAVASSLKGMERNIKDTVDYTSQRNAFGKPLIANQAVRFRLGELQTEVECLRSLLYRMIESYVAGEDVTMLASMGKLKAGRLSREVATSCLQYWGGMGYMWDNPVSRSFRDSRLGSIGGGADEIMLEIICKFMGTGQAKRKDPGKP